MRGLVKLRREAAHFFFPPAAASSFRSHVTTLPSITTPLPSMKATRERPSQFLNVSQTNGCCGWKAHSAISLDFKECGSSIFFAHLPAQFGDAARRPSTSHKANWGVADLDF